MKLFLEKIKNKKYFRSYLLFFLLFFPSISFADLFPSFDELLIDFGTLFINFGGWILNISGIVFDNLLAITLSTNLFNANFIKIAWSNIRDLANIVFILGAIIIAFSMMFNYGNWRKSLVALIVVVFLLNFSLYFARVIVDMGNITAHIFIKPISVEVDDKAKRFSFAEPFYRGNNEAFNNLKSVSGGIASSLNIEEAFGESSFKTYKTKLKEAKNGGSFLFLAIVTFGIMLITAKSIFVGGFIFLGRMVWIIYYMISAPFFFITAFIPGQEKLWKDKWLIPLLQKSFCVSVYLFFLWMAIMILTSDFLIDTKGVFNKVISSGEEKAGSEMSTTSIFLSVLVIKAIFVVKMLDMGNDLGTRWCEDGKSTLGAVLGGAGKIAGGVMKFTPLGSVSRTIMGGIGKRFAGSNIVQNLSSSKNSKIARWSGDRMALFGDKLQKVKIGGKDYESDQKKRMANLRELEQRLPKDKQKQRKFAEMGLYNKKGDLKIDKIEKVADTDRQKDLDVLKKKDDIVSNFEERDMYKYEEVASVDLEKTLENMFRVEGEKLGLEGDRLEGHIQAGMESYKNGSLDSMTEEIAQEFSRIKESEKNLNEKLKPDDVLLKESDSLVGRAMNYVPIPAASVESRHLRIKKDQENVEEKIKTNEKIEAKKKKHQEISNKAEAQKMKVSELQNTIMESIESGKSKEALEEIKKLKNRANDIGVDPALMDTFEKIKNDISKLVAIEKEEERIENLKMFEDEDYRAEDFDDNKVQEKLKILYENEPEKLAEVQKEIDFAKATGHDEDLKRTLKRKYSEVVKGSEDGNPIRNKVKRSLKNATQSVSSSISSMAQFEKARVDEEVEVMIGQQTKATAKTQTEASTTEKISAKEM